MQQRDETSQPPRPGLLDRFLAPWRNARRDDVIDAKLDRIDVAVSNRIPARLAILEAHMADVSPILNQLAQDLRSWSAGPFAALLAENTRLTARNAELEGEDAAESTAADNAVSAFNNLVNPVTASPDVPVEIPPVEVPAETPAAPEGENPPPAAA